MEKDLFYKKFCYFTEFYKLSLELRQSNSVDSVYTLISLLTL